MYDRDGNYRRIIEYLFYHQSYPVRLVSGLQLHNFRKTDAIIPPAFRLGFELLGSMLDIRITHGNIRIYS